MVDWEPSPDFDKWTGCRNCGHYRGMQFDAYPYRIPFAIASGQVDHLVPRPGQVGSTVFTPFDLEVFKATGKRVPASASEATKAS